MGPEEADVLIVLLARIYDLVSVREVPSGPQLHRCIRAAQMAASDYVLIFFRNRLHLVGRPQIALGRPLIALNCVTIGS